LLKQRMQKGLCLAIVSDRLTQQTGADQNSVLHKRHYPTSGVSENFLLIASSTRKQNVFWF